MVQETKYESSYKKNMNTEFLVDIVDLGPRQNNSTEKFWSLVFAPTNSCCDARNQIQKQ